MEDMSLRVERLARAEKATALLYDAAANCSHLALAHEDNSPIYNGIKAQEAAIEALCKTERREIADIIRREGMLTKEIRLPFVPGGTEWYVHCGSLYRIVTEFDGEITQIIQCPDYQLT